MKYALITGASRGIGKAAAEKLADDGFYILINYRSNKAEALNTLNSIIEIGGKAELMQFDISNQEETENALEKWFENNHPKNEGRYFPDNFLYLKVGNLIIGRKWD